MLPVVVVLVASDDYCEDCGQFIVRLSNTGCVKSFYSLYK
jgi:hypothetical protein